MTTQDVQRVECDALVLGVPCFTNEQGQQQLRFSSLIETVDSLLNRQLQESYQSGEFKGTIGELLTIHSLGRLAAKRVVFIGLGNEQKLNAQLIHRASATALRSLQQTGAHQIVLAPIEHHVGEVSSSVQAQIEGAIFGLYNFRKYQTTSPNGKNLPQLHLLITEREKSELQTALDYATALGEATNFARDLVNEPANVLTPTELAHRATTMAKQFSLEYEVFERDRIEALRMGGLLAVSQGSAHEPRFIILRYRGAPEKEQCLGLVGKGVTFDTGGISIKPPDRMDEMKGDMGGAAAVIGAMQAIAALKPAINVTALIPTCENMPSSTSYRPGDILRIMNGKTIEIINTDAEGRLILADALSYAVQEKLSPIIDLATLTGGIVVALGHTLTGLFSNDMQLTEQLVAAGLKAGEKVWPMPMDEEYGEQIRSEIADIKQTGGRAASSVTAAKILEHFVAGTRWAHLDIAGTSYFESRKPYQEKGATGVGVRLLTEFVLRQKH